MIITNETKIHCLFEQSGTFKNSFIKLGYTSLDYDILNDYKQTNYIIDIFNEIDKYKNGLNNIFYSFQTLDIVFAFFPCTYFEVQSIMHYTGNAKQLIDKTLLDKLHISRKRHHNLFKYLNYLYDLIDICINNNFQLIIENPYSKSSYLLRYTPLTPDVIHLDRSIMGDIVVKPTMYFFINCKPNLNIDLADNNYYGDLLSISHISYGAKRSLISSDYAINFIKKYIL